MRRKLIAFLIAMLILITGCTKLEDFSGESTDSEPSQVSHEQVAYKEYQIEESDLSIQLEAENALLQGGVTVESERDGYSGEGYVKWNDNLITSQCNLTATIPTSGHYKLTVSLASDSEIFSYLLIGGETIGELHIHGDGSFEQISLDSIYLSKGEQTISISQQKGEAYLDYVTISGSQRINDENYEVESELINQNAKNYAQSLMDFLTDNYGKANISAQQVTGGTNMELDFIKELTGKYPAIRSGDLGEYSLSRTGKGNGEIELAAKWWQSGGIVAFSWYWYAPMNTPELLSEKTSFNLSNAVTELEVATLTIEEIEQLELEGKVSAELVAIIRDIDHISEQLALLQSEKTPVLWRPLPEAGGGWYWWGNAGSTAYKWLWKLLVDRQTNYHELNNLIWVWNGEYADFYPGDNYVDMISADIFVSSPSALSQQQRFIASSQIAKPPKLIALSECSSLPDPDLMYRENAMWSWVSAWGGASLLTPDGKINPEYNEEESVVNFYNHIGVITKDELPYLARYTKD